jgi:hypothetical protein
MHMRHSSLFVDSTACRVIRVRPTTNNETMGRRASTSTDDDRVARHTHRHTYAKSTTDECQHTDTMHRASTSASAAASTPPSRSATSPPSFGVKTPHPSLLRVLLLLCALFALGARSFVLDASAQAATYTTTFPNPPTRAGWMPGSSSGSNGVALFDDPAGGANQFITLSSASDVTGPWPPSTNIGGSGGNHFSVCVWMHIGPDGAASATSSSLSPGLFFTGGANILSLVLTRQLGGYIFLAYTDASTYSYASFGSTAPWTPYQSVQRAAHTPRPCTSRAASHLSVLLA